MRQHGIAVDGRYIYAIPETRSYRHVTQKRTMAIRTEALMCRSENGCAGFVLEGTGQPRIFNGESLTRLAPDRCVR